MKNISIKLKWTQRFINFKFSIFNFLAILALNNFRMYFSPLKHRNLSRFEKNKRKFNKLKI